MYSSRDVNSDILHPPSPPETIPSGVPPHVAQSNRHRPASWPANVSSNSATIHQIHNDSTTSVPRRRAKPRRFLGLRSFANLAGKIPFFRRTPRLASENHVTASAQPSRREHRPAYGPSFPILHTTSHDRGGQAPAGADHAQNVAERPVFLSKLSDILFLRARRKQQQSVAHPSPAHPPIISPPPRGLLPNRTSQEAGSDTPLSPEARQLGEQNQALRRQAHSPHKRDVTRPCYLQVDRTPSDQPSVGTSTYPPASLNYPGVSASSSSSRPIQPLRRTYVPKGPPPEKLKAPRIGAPSRLPHFPDEGDGRALPNKHAENPSVTPNDRVHTDPPWEPQKGPSSLGNDPQAVAHSEDDNREVFVDANSVSDNGPRLPKPELASHDLRSMLATDKLT